MKLTAIPNGPTWTIFTSGELRVLQMVSKLDTGQCARKDVRPPRRVDCEIQHKLEMGTKHSL